MTASPLKEGVAVILKSKNIRFNPPPLFDLLKQKKPHWKSSVAFY
jgi:hypothetical protein